MLPLTLIRDQSWSVEHVQDEQQRLLEEQHQSLDELLRSQLQTRDLFKRLLEGHREQTQISTLHQELLDQLRQQER